MPRPLQIFMQSDYLIQIFDSSSHTEWQTVQIQISWLLRSQLIWIYTVCKGSVYPGSTGLGLKKFPGFVLGAGGQSGNALDKGGKCLGGRVLSAPRVMSSQV